MSGTRRQGMEIPGPPRPLHWPCRAANVITGLSLYGGLSLLWFAVGYRLVFGPPDGTVYEWAKWLYGSMALALVIPLFVALPVLILGLILARWKWLLWSLFNLAVVLGALTTTWVVTEHWDREAYRREVEAQPTPDWLQAPPPSGVPEGRAE